MSLLTVRGLRVSLSGSAILQGVDFSVPPTGVTALLGRNGVGKTTTLRALMGLVPGLGGVEFAGADLLTLPTHRIARLGIGYVPEDRAVFAGLSVAENLRLAERRDGGEPRYDFVHELFPVLKARAAQAAGTLSGGEQQMLALARVMLGRQRLLLVDEPTKGLAPRIAVEVGVALQRVAEEVPVLLVEQNLTIVRRIAGEAIVLDHGQVVHTGDAQELLADPVLANRLLGVASSVASSGAGASTAASSVLSTHPTEASA